MTGDEVIVIAFVAICSSSDILLMHLGRSK